MTTEWIRQHVNPKLVAQYERAMNELRGDASQREHIVKNIKQLNTEVEQVETDEQRRARDLAEDEEMERFFRNNR